MQKEQNTQPTRTIHEMLMKIIESEKARLAKQGKTIPHYQVIKNEVSDINIQNKMQM